MGLVRKKDIKNYWDVTNASQATPFFPATMTLDRYLLIRRMLHVNDNEKTVARGLPGYDPWHKIRPLLDTLNALWKRHYTPEERISIDESLVAMKNRTVFIQYLPNKKHAQFGIKKFELCEARTGYTLGTLFYSGRDIFANPGKMQNNISIFHDATFFFICLRCIGRHGQAYDVVFRLLREANLLHKWHHLITDNWYDGNKIYSFIS
jgi:hypothetical protein